MTAIATRQPVATAGRVRLADAVRMEWLKLKTLRSSRWLALITVAGVIGIGLAVLTYYPGHYAHMNAASKASFDPTNQGFTGMVLGQLTAGIAGVLMMTSEFSSGSIRATLAAVPRRRMLLAAKALVLAVTVLLIGEVTGLITFLIGQYVVLQSVPVHASLAQAAPLRAVLMIGAYLPLMALLGLGLGAMIRHTAGAISALVGLVFALTTIFAVLPASILHAYGRYLPMVIAENSLSAVKPDPYSLSPWAGFLLLCGYVAAALLGAAWLSRRDA
ncbi:MAG TPA: ABC transporter permease [Streptosporangiaceae bacterium]